MMGEMFASPARPFYQSATVISLKPIPLQSYTQFITHHFEVNGRGINPEAIHHLYETFEGVTWYIQKICNEVFATTDIGHVADTADIETAIEYAVEEKNDTYQDLMARLTTKQKALLVALGHEGKDVQPTSGDFIKKYHLSSTSAVQRALSALQEKDIITNENGKFYIYDYFLTYWIKR